MKLTHTPYPSPITTTNQRRCAWCLCSRHQEIDDAKALLDAAREKEAAAKAALDTALSNAAAPANNCQRRNARQNYVQIVNCG
jgi:hypothetical protein